MNREHAVDRHDVLDERRRWLRLIAILDAADWAGITPLSTQTLHAIAYLADVLSPAWHLEPMDGKILKQSLGPYYPSLQQDMDRLIGMGLVKVDRLSTTKNNAGDLKLEGLFSLNTVLANPIIEALRELPDELNLLSFLSEVVQAFSRLPDEEMSTVMAEDATYGDPSIDTGDVIDLGEWTAAWFTASAYAARRINELADHELKPAETIDIYVTHIMKRVINGA